MQPPMAPGQPGNDPPDGDVWSRLFLNRVFRARALQRRARQEPLDDRLQITAPHEWLIAAGLGVIVAALVAFSVFGRVERTLSLEAALVIPGERHYLVAPVSGTVRDVLLEVHDAVAPGQPVALIRPFDAGHWTSAIAGIVTGLEQNGQLDEATRSELLRALPISPTDSSASSIEVSSQTGGEVVALNLAPGQVVDAGALVGLVHAAPAGRPEVLAFVAPSQAATLSVGMEARISIADPDGGAVRILDGQVEEVSARAELPPDWLAEKGLAIPGQAHRLRIALVGDGSGAVPADGAVTSLQILLGRESLLSFLTTGDGG